MSDPDFHVAQANIGRGHAPVTDPVMKGFVDQLVAINSIADRAPGFVWRLQTDEGDATSVRPFEDPPVMVNMSVWRSIEELYRFVFESDHVTPLQNRQAWFEKMERPYSVLWWICAGEFPDTADLVHRFDLLRDRGPSPAAFTFGSLFDPSGRPMARPDWNRECDV